jgi:hypothetical protein
MLKAVQAIGSETIVRAMRGHMRDEAFQRSKNIPIVRNRIKPVFNTQCRL